MNFIKSENDNEESVIREPRLIEDIPAHVLYSEVFTKPSKLNGCLGERMRYLPLFLRRNLTYMHRPNKKKNKPKLTLDSIIDTLTSYQHGRSQKSGVNDYLKLTFCGLYVKNIPIIRYSYHIAQVEVVRTENFRRNLTPVGIAQVPINPLPNSSATYASSVILTKKIFSRDFDCNLLIRVKLDQEIIFPFERYLRRKTNSDFFMQSITKLYTTEMVILNGDQQLIANNEFKLLLHEVPDSRNDEIFRRRHGNWNVTGRLKNKRPEPKVGRTKKILSCRLDWVKGSKERSSDVDKLEFQQIDYVFLFDSCEEKIPVSWTYCCPWCKINCIDMYGLLKHLNLIHLRYSFTFRPVFQGFVIFIRQNESFDDTIYISNLSTLTKRVPVTEMMLVHRQQRTEPNVNEFIEMNDCHQLPDKRKNRLSLHTELCIPVYLSSMTINRDDIPYPLERYEQVRKFSMYSLELGEKMFIFLWNSYISQQAGSCCFTDNHITKTCDLFIQVYGNQVIERKLYKYFVLHLVNLYKAEMIDSISFLNLTMKIQNLAGGSQAVHKYLTAPNDRDAEDVFKIPIRYHQEALPPQSSTKTLFRREDRLYLQMLKRRLVNHVRLNGNTEMKVYGNYGGIQNKTQHNSKAVLELRTKQEIKAKAKFNRKLVVLCERITRTGMRQKTQRNIIRKQIATKRKPKFVIQRLTRSQLRNHLCNNLNATL